MLAILLSAAVVAGAPGGFTKVAFRAPGNPPKPICTLESQASTASGLTCTYRCPDGTAITQSAKTTCPASSPK